MISRGVHSTVAAVAVGGERGPSSNSCPFVDRTQPGGLLLAIGTVDSPCLPPSLRLTVLCSTRCTARDACQVFRPGASNWRRHTSWLAVGYICSPLLLLAALSTVLSHRPHPDAFLQPFHHLKPPQIPHNLVDSWTPYFPAHHLSPLAVLPPVCGQAQSPRLRDPQSARRNLEPSSIGPRILFAIPDLGFGRQARTTLPLDVVTIPAISTTSSSIALIISDGNSDSSSNGHFQQAVKREDEMAYMNRVSGAAQTLPAVTAASPTVYHPLGPPPPYSHAPSQHVNAWSTGPIETSSPHDSRRPSDDEQDGPKHITRQSLPSLSEALGVDGQTPFPTSATAALLPPPPSAPAHTSRTQLAAIASPSPSLKRGYGMDAPRGTTHAAYGIAGGQHTAHSQNQPESLPSQAPPPAPSSQPPVEGMSQSYPSVTDRLPVHAPALQSAARPSAPAANFVHAQSSAAEYEQPPTQPRGAMAPPNLPYGYTPYASRHALPVTNGSGAGPLYQPSTSYPPPSAPSWKHDNMQSKFEGREYGESVKCHLDLYDLGTALREIASTSSITSDFARRYDDQLQQPGRSGPILQSLPGLVEVDDMISKSRVQLESLLRIRDFVVDQRALYEQEAADQRQQKLLVDQSQADFEYMQDGGDGKSRLAASDAKKRRGRAAPPGRCHSCNRAETPEWRRGPDGARTLCNACGLHYAKLTRKQQGTKQSNAVGTSNLRPKE
nr:gata zinc finger domain-containing protein 8 [Quercus suber]